MDTAIQRASSARLFQALSRSRHSLTRQKYQQIRPLQQHILPSSSRYASSSSSIPPPPPSSKPIVLEQPDKFRPPSHAARRNARSTTGTYGAGAAYNQGMSAREREASRKKKYPHMFPEEGTRMYWFLTSKWVHVLITMTLLLSLAFASICNTWSNTTPFAHLIPPLSSLPLHPINYFSELISVYRLHLSHQTDLAAASRRSNIADAQKRRLYRRAHGLEDLNADEVSGVDVRGLVEWDDGMTRPERERGGQYRGEMIGAQMIEMGRRPDEGFSELMERKRREEGESKVRKEEERREAVSEAERREEERLVRIRGGVPGFEEGRRRKVWFGIW